MTSQKLDKSKLENYKKILLKLKEDFTQDIRNIAHNSGENGESRDVSGHVMHIADVATDMYDREFNLGLASNERAVLHKIESALKRVDDQSFGICAVCKKQIPAARLQAIPYAETCLKCQEQLENGKS